MAYHLEGRLLKVCDCRVLCPCSIGEDPDYKTCDTIVAWHFDKGSVDGVDVGGRTLAMLAHVPGNILQGNWTAAVYLDDGASPAQEKALLDVYTAEKGGPVADLAKLVGKVVSVPEGADHLHRARRKRDDQGGRRRVRPSRALQERVRCETTTLTDTVFSTVPGAPVFVGKATEYRSKNHAGLGRDIDLKGHNALQSTFVFDA